MLRTKDAAVHEGCPAENPESQFQVASSHKDLSVSSAIQL